MSTPKLAAADSVGWPKDLPLLPHPAEIIVGLVAFAILYWLYAKKVVPRMEEMYAERTAAIEGGMEEAEAAQKEAEAAKAKYEKQLSEAHAEAGKIREDARAQGADIVAEARTQAGVEAGRITESAHKSIEAERQAAAVSLRGDVGRMSTDLAGRIVGESLEDETRQRGIVERFLADLEAGDAKTVKAGAKAEES
ncbi:F0F1 ATP synthase subunit B [Demetria terragena]|uniref:F0F1 ATP synthase subunit B n=1 Tax=Demetria terragena TaxID=63959 RepID=UPI0003628E41|nr:F0F1 ATP synthase subunit B [Demetria terragena]